MTSRKFLRSAIAVVGASCLILLTAHSASAALARAKGAGQLRDLQAITAQPFDHATAQVVAREASGKTTVTLKVQGISHDVAGKTFGAHVHSGTCVEGNGTLAGPHYNAGGGISKTTEVWLDFKVAKSGTANSTATVPFVIPAGGAGSVVIHELSTNATTGAAGARWACLPVLF